MIEPTDRTDILGIDVGGANLKYATADGRCFDRPFAMWTRWSELADQLAEDIAPFDGARHLAVTMTGELADCFPSRAAGVAHIIDQVMLALPKASLESAAFYGTDGQFHDAATAKRNWECIAASNWHALASCVGIQIAGDALLIDVGSTTTDVIAIRDGHVLTSARTDSARLADRSLVYVGCRRTPVCALVSKLMLKGKPIPVMNEVFATIDDARLMVGWQAEEPQDLATADARPRDRPHAHGRLARMIGLDRDQLSHDQAIDIATQINQAAIGRIDSAVERWWQRLITSTPQTPTCVLSGHGQDLVSTPEGCDVIDLQSDLSASVARTAPAWAVATLSHHQRRSAR